MGMVPYVVKQGDYLTQIAHDLGFDADAAWNDDKNAELRDKRPDKNMLYPGDVLYYPEAEPNPAPMAQGSENGYAADVPTVKITLVFQGAGQPLAGEAFEVESLPVTSGSTDGSGEASFDVPVNVREFNVVFTNQPYAYRVLVGHMDPPTESSGIKARLWNLGFHRRDCEPEDADALKAAISAFQTAKGLPVTGDVDDATRAAIVDAHGS